MNNRYICCFSVFFFSIFLRVCVDLSIHAYCDSGDSRDGTQSSLDIPGDLTHGVADSLDILGDFIHASVNSGYIPEYLIYEEWRLDFMHASSSC